jgi:hypothetical protein
MNGQTNGTAVRFMIRAAVALLAAAAPALAQTSTAPVGGVIKLSGPRVGVTVLSDGVVRKLRVEDEVDVSSAITQFGWQFEKRFDGTGSSRLTPVTEWVVLLGGLEQGVVLPSLSWLVGIRTREGVELGVGPNLTPVGAALAVAAGMTFRSGALNFPLNLAVVPSKAGVRVSLLSGFNMRR